VVARETAPLRKAANCHASLRTFVLVGVLAAAFFLLIAAYSSQTFEFILSEVFYIFVPHASIMMYEMLLQEVK
jgi:hypothetical protein